MARRSKGDIRLRYILYTRAVMIEKSIVRVNKVLTDFVPERERVSCIHLETNVAATCANFPYRAINIVVICRKTSR